MNPETYDAPAEANAEAFDYNSTELLTAEQEVELAVQIEAGRAAADELHRLAKEGAVIELARRRELRQQEALGKRARDRFIMSNLGLVHSCARPYGVSGIPHEDLVQYGIGAVAGINGPRQTGLIHAVDKFDYRQGVKFSSYAVGWINNALQQAVNLHRSAIRVPRNVSVKIKNYDKTERRLSQKHQVAPNDEDMVRELGCGIDEVQELRLLRNRYWIRGAVLSLDELITNDADGGLADSGYYTADHSSDPVDNAHIERLALRQAIGQLSTEQQVVVSMIYGLEADGRTYGHQAIARHTGMSLKDVQTSIDVALSTLRQSLTGSDERDTVNDAAMTEAPKSSGIPLPDTRVQQAIATLAADIPLEVWFIDPELHPVTEQGLGLLKAPHAATAMDGRYGFSGPRRSDQQMARDLSIGPTTLPAIRTRARKQLAAALPAIIAGTYDFDSPDNGQVQQPMLDIHEVRQVMRKYGIRPLI